MMEGNEITQNVDPKKALCKDCAQTFPTMSCYNEGKNFLCPVCSGFLVVGRRLESPTNDGRVSPDSKITRSRTFVPRSNSPFRLQRGATMIPKPISKPKRTNLTKNFQRAKTFAEGTNIQPRDTESGFLPDAKTSNVKLKSHFRCREFGGCINSIWPVSPLHSWIVIKNSEVALYDRKGGLQHKVTGIHQNITDLALDSERNMYLVCFKERLVLKVTLKTGLKISVFAQMTMTHPTEISTSPRDHVIVAGVGVTSVRYVPGIGREYGVFIYDTHGKMLRKILRTKQEFQYPLYVGVNKHEEIAVGDYLLKKVVLMSIEGREISSFDGSTTFSRPFIPKGLCFDQLGNVVVANWDGNVCILLRDEGFSSVGLRFDKQFSPLSLAVDEGNELWIGHRKGGNVEVYEVDYSKLREENRENLKEEKDKGNASCEECDADKKESRVSATMTIYKSPNVSDIPVNTHREDVTVNKDQGTGVSDQGDYQQTGT